MCVFCNWAFRSNRKFPLYDRSNGGKRWAGDGGATNYMAEVFLRLELQSKSIFRKWVTFCRAYPTFNGGACASLLYSLSCKYVPTRGFWSTGVATNSYSTRMRVKLCFLVRYNDDPWLWVLDWSVQNVRTKKLKPPKKKREKKKTKSEVTDQPKNPSDKVTATPSVEKTSAAGFSGTTDDDDDIEDLDYTESTALLSTIPPAEDVMYKRRQHLAGYPGWEHTVDTREHTPHLNTWEVMFSQLPKCLDEAILHGNKLYISFMKLFARKTNAGEVMHPSAFSSNTVF